MNSQQKGASFEKIAEEFFLSVFAEMEMQVNNHWIQKSGMQFGFDVGFELALLNDDFFKRGIFVECKNYEKAKLAKSDLHEKLLEFEMSSYEKKGAIFLFLSPKVDVSQSKQDSNPKLLEDFFNKTKQFKTIILTPINRIQEILSLNEAIFKKVYGIDDFDGCSKEQKEAILGFFKKLIYSKAEIPNFQNAEKKEPFLQEATIKQFKTTYMSRTISSDEFSFFDEDLTMLEALKKHDVILLKGEPGSGKSTELKYLADHFESEIERYKITPIFVSLSNVKQFSTINDLLPLDWHLASKIILLLDALDEFQFKEQLAEALINFRAHKDVMIKIVISCRTYAYNNELAILEPNAYHLNGFDTQTSLQFLSKNFGFSNAIFNKLKENSFEEIMKDPFLINKVGQYYKAYNNIPETPSDVFKFIESKISNKADVEQYKVLALLFELTKKNNVTGIELKQLFGVKSKKIIKLSLIRKSFDGNNYGFIHKNYQEYFAALAISELSFSKIIDFIVIKGTDKIHLSLYNTTTFLINILDKNDKYNQLVNWLVLYNPELLFKSDYSRISPKIRTKVFRTHFESECRNKTFWINTRNTVEIDELARFGDSLANYDYLCNIISDRSNHYRMIISAIEILSFIRIPKGKKKIHKTFLMNQLVVTDSNEKEISIKSNLIGLIDNQKLILNDYNYLNEILVLFKNETHNELNRSILGLIRDYDDVDALFVYIHKEFQRANGIKPREIHDNVSRGNAYVINDLVLRFKSSDNFLIIIRYFFSDEYSFYSDDNLLKKFGKKSIAFAAIEDDFIIRFLSILNRALGLSIYDKFIANVITLSNNVPQSLEFIVANKPFDSIRLLIATLINVDNIRQLSDLLISNGISNLDIELFRNYIGNINNRDLAVKFHNIMETKGVIFKEKVYTNTDLKNHQKSEAKKIQYSLDVLFNKELLKRELVSVFTKASRTTLSIDNIIEIESEWYTKNRGAGIVIHPAISILHSLAINRDILHVNDVDSIVGDTYFVMSQIQSKITSYKNINYQYKLSLEQIEQITQWCLQTSKQIDFDKIIILHDLNSFSYGSNYDLLKCILFFYDEFKFSFTKQFLLRCIEFVIIDGIGGVEENFNNHFTKINDKILFDEYVIDLISKKVLYGSVKSILIRYALDNNLVATLPGVREYILENNSIYNESKKLEKYYKITNDVSLLIELGVDVTNSLCWSAIGLLLKNELEKEFTINIAIGYLDSEETAYIPNALNVLFKWQVPRAMMYYLKFINNDRYSYLSDRYFSSYTIIEDYNVLKKLFNKIYLDNLDRFSLRFAQSFYKSYISNLSKTDIGYEAVQNILQELKEELSVVGEDLFYVNMHIEDSKSIYFLSKSQPFNFENAFEKIEEIMGA